MSAARPEFSFPVDATALPPSGRHYEIEASPAERTAVAARLGVLGISALKASFDLKPRAGGIVSVTGTVEASLTQTCVVTLAAVAATIREGVEARFTTLGPVKPAPTALGRGTRKTDKEAETPADFSAEEPPEEAVGGEVDLGELAVAQVVLGLDPYPRAPGAAFEPRPWGEKVEKSTSEGPFAALAKLKPKRPPAKGN